MDRETRYGDRGSASSGCQLKFASRIAGSGASSVGLMQTAPRQPLGGCDWPSPTQESGLGLVPKDSQWHKATSVQKRQLVVQEVRKQEEAEQHDKAVSMAKRGQWANWESLEKRKLSWQMEGSRLSFVTRATYNVLPSPQNLKHPGTPLILSSNTCITKLLTPIHRSARHICSRSAFPQDEHPQAPHTAVDARYFQLLTPIHRSARHICSRSALPQDEHPQAPHTDYDGEIQRLEDKETLFMLLALHMEESPLCESPISEPPGDQINKTGIVMCESTSIQRIVAMDCSRKQLHAVQLVMMNLTTMAKGCNVYLSRKPCTECAKCLVQGGVRSVRFWPKDPEFSLSSDKKRKDFYETNQIFRKSNTILVPFIPIINETTVYNLCRRTRRQKCEQCLKSTSEPSLEEELNTNWMDCGFTPQSDIEGMKAMIKSTVCSYYALLNCSHGTMPEHEEISLGIATHGLQLCFLLAARSDDPHRGVGAIIYNKKQYIVGAGYNGYIKKATYGNFPRRGQKKNSIPAKAKSMVHAEVNTLLLRSDRDIDSAVLVSSKTPCKECEMKIIASGIKTMVSVKDVPESKRDKEWKHIVWKWPKDVQVYRIPFNDDC
ncbi:cytidine and dCMP deaminase domain-containing protein 1-like [Amblyraja radiata]|uniref:cytidine and dCMP deaminase domain-containing protein 1-like n=1 Tax=Amblyraja radiata TaxID=386614 RepID=UPI001402BDB0|nr:cytidine and dCMP deaminase domain-containing protein 1-like [Amblyraja radiata]